MTNAEARVKQLWEITEIGECMNRRWGDLPFETL